MEIILLKRLHDMAVKPCRAYPDDAGLDLFVVDRVELPPKTFCDVGTGWAIKMPDGYWGSVKARSSTFFKRGLIVHEGTIDTGYTGPLSIGIYNPMDTPVVLQAFDRVAQLVVIPLVICHPRIVNEFPKTMRGSEGFGSTGTGV